MESEHGITYKVVWPTYITPIIITGQKSNIMFRPGVFFWTSYIACRSFSYMALQSGGWCACSISRDPFMAISRSRRPNQVFIKYLRITRTCQRHACILEFYWHHRGHGLLSWHLHHNMWAWCWHVPVRPSKQLWEDGLGLEGKLVA